MALKQNTTGLAALPLRQIGGSISGVRSMWGRTEIRNQSIGQGIPTRLAGVPAGHLAPSSWVLPYRAGAMSAFTSVVVQFATGTPTIVAGRNIDGGAAISFVVGPSDGQLVVSAVGSTSIDFSGSATLAGALSASGGTQISFAVPNATLGAIVDALGNAAITWTQAATPSAIGHMSGDITPFTELSPQNLAAAVWQAMAAEYNASGTMGNKLNFAASGGVDYDTLAQYVWQYVNRTLTGGSALTLPEFLALKD